MTIFLFLCLTLAPHPSFFAPAFMSLFCGYEGSNMGPGTHAKIGERKTNNENKQSKTHDKSRVGAPQIEIS